MTTPASVSENRPDPLNKPDALRLILRVAAFILIGRLGVLVFGILMVPMAGLLVGSALSTFAGAALANVILVRIFEHGRLSDLGLGGSERSLKDFLTGIGAGIGAAAAVVVVPLALEWATFEAVPIPAVDHPWGSFALISVVLLFGAFGEEMLFHGYAFQLLVRSIGAFATILPVSILFGLAHLSNQNATLLGILNTVAWGVLLGYAFVRTNALWLPIGLHFGWNFTLPLFGASLSGFTMGLTGYGLLWKVGVLWSGGAYGPEGGLFTTAVVVVLFFVLQRLTPE